MKNNPHILGRSLFSLLVATLVCGLTHSASAASIGTPTYSAIANSSPQTNDLTHVGLFNDLDWQIYNGAATTLTNGTVNLMTVGNHKAGGSSITNLGLVAFTPTTVDGTSARSATAFTWSDGAAPNTAGTNNPNDGNNGWRVNNAATFAADVNYETLQFVPGDTNSHTVYIYGYYNNGSTVTLQFETGLPGVATPPVLNPAFVAGNFIYSVSFQADHPTDALTVKVTLVKTSTAGTLTVAGISAAAIANYVPNMLVWQGGSSANWDTTTANWSGASTTYSDAYGALFDDTASQFSVNVSSTINPQAIYVTNSASDYTISGSPIAGSGVLVKTGSRTLTLSGANTFSGGVQVNGGYLTLGASGTLPNGAGKGDVAINPGATLNLNGFNQTVNGLNGVGTVDIPTASGGTSTLTVGNNNASSAFSGNIQNTFGTVSLVKTGTGTLTLSGSNTFSGGISLNAGQLNINSTSAIGSGTFTIAGGALDNTSGGTLTLSTANAQNWNGDFTVIGSSPLNMGNGAVTMSGSRAIAVSNATFTVGGGVSDGGHGYGLTKNGAGQLNITGSNTFSGPIIVNAGTLLMNTTATGGGSLTVAPGANLQVNLSTNNQTLNVAALVLQGTAVISTNSFTNNLTFNYLTSTNSSNAFVTTPSLTVSNSVVINISANANTTLVPGQYPLIKYSGSIGGAGFSAFSLGTIPANSIMSLVDNSANHSVDLNITVIAGPPKTWVGYINGALNSTWDINTTTNWTAAVTGSNQVAYTETPVAGDSVVFSDTASNYVVNVVTAVKPALITVNNSTNDYTISGSPITSLASLVKQGSMGLTMTGNNTFSNGVTLSGGTLRIGSGNSPLGTGLLIFNNTGVTLSSDGTSARVVTNGISVRNVVNSFNLGDSTNAGSLTLSGPINLNNNGPTFALLSDVLLSGGSTNGVIGLSSVNTNNPNLAGTNTLTLHGVHRWNQGATITSGTMLLDGASVTNSSGIVQVAVNQTNGLARLIITNGGVLVMTGTNVTMRLGGSAFGNTTAGATSALATNELDVSGVFATPNSTNKVIMGRSANLSVINLLPNGYMQVGGVTFSDLVNNRCPSLFNFNGGTLAPTTDSDNFMPVNASFTANVQAGGAFIDTSGWNVTVKQPLLEDPNSTGGGLTKNGNGTLTLSGANTYTGQTTVNQGELVLPTGLSVSGAIVVNDPGSLGINVAAQGGTLTVNSSVTLGNTSGHNGNLDLNLGSIAFNPGSTAPLTVTGNVNVNGTTTININTTNTLYIGQYPLISYSGSSFNGSFSSLQLGPLPAGNAGSLSNNTANSSIDLVITNGLTSPLEWNGASGINLDWDINTTANWLDTGLSQQSVYTDGRVVEFDDNNNGNYSVNVAANVSPFSVTVNNNNSDYSIGGSGVIGGSVALVKTGTANLTLTSSNSYTGGTTVSSGIVRLGAAGALGGGLVTLNGGGLSSDGGTARTLLNGVAINTTNATVIGDSVNTGLVNLAGLVNWSNAVRALNIPSSVILSGGSTNGSFSKTNTGVLTFQSSTHYFKTTCDLLEGDTVYDGATINSTAGNLVRVYCQTPAGQARLIVTNGATAVDSAAGSGNIYVGYYTNSDSASTNMLVLSGRLATGSGGSVRMGANCALAEIDLLNNGVLEAGGVRVDTNNAPVFGESRLNFDGGTLRANASSTSFLGGLTNAFVLNGGATIDSSNYNITVTQPLLQAGSGGLTKVGSGVLTLDSVNTYTNTTLVSAGTLAGTGTIAGPLSVGANASLAPGDGGIGTLTVSGPLSLATGSTNYVKVNASTGTNDLVTGFTKVTYAGTLVVSNLAGTPVLNQSFHIFSAVAAPVGTITNIIPAPAAGLAWSFNPTNGMLTAVAGAQKNPTVFNSVTISNGNLTISGTNGVAGGQYVILSTTNLALPLVNWQPEVTNTFDVNGHFTYTLSLTNAGPQRFYTVRQ